MPAGIQAEADQKSEAQVRREHASAQLEAENAAEVERREDEAAAPSLSGTTAIEGEDSLRASEDTARVGLGGEGDER